MAADFQDWTQPVQVLGGTVQIGGTATVQISGTPTVQFAAGQTVSISGVPAVTISGTPTVQFAAGQTVSITGVVSVSISSGTVNIGNTPNITIAGQNITVNTNQPQTLVLDRDLAGPASGGSWFTAQLPAGTHAVEVYWSAGTVPLSRIASWNLQGGATSIFYRNFAVAPDTLAYPIRISGIIENNGLKINTTFAPALGAGETVHVKVVALLDAIVPTITGQDSYAHVDPLRTRLQAYDATVLSGPGSGVQAVATLGAVAGKRWVAAMLAANFYNLSGADTSIDAQLVDGATMVYSVSLRTANGASKEQLVTELAFPGSVGNAMTWQGNGGVAGSFEKFTIGAYQE